MFGFGEEEIELVSDTLRRGVLTRFQGGTKGYLAQAERSLAEMAGVKHALMVNSGTSALISALVALGIGPGDDVLVSAYTWISTPLAPMLLGGIPRLVEIDESLTMDPVDLERKITPSTKCIMVIHMANRPCDMERIMSIADRHGIPVIEDACQSAGGLYHGRRLGSIGRIGVFSFNNYKNISCGEGGAVLTDDDELFDRARLWHDAGTFVQSYDSPVKIPFFAGQDYRASEIEGALICAQLKRLDPGFAKLRLNVELARSILAKKYHVSRHNDPSSAASLALTFPSSAEFLEFSSRTGLKSIRDVAGRHIYTNWTPLVEKRAYRDDINPFLTTESGRSACYDETAAPVTLDILSRTVYATPEWNWTEDQVKDWANAL